MNGLLVNVDVADLAKAVEFYRRGLGLHPGRTLFDGAVVEMLGAASPIYLIEQPSGSGASAASPATRDYARHWTPVHLDFVVEDVEAAVARAREAGATLEGGVRTHEWGRIATLADPFGHGFCLLQFAGRGYDEVADPDPGGGNRR